MKPIVPCPPAVEKISPLICANPIRSKRGLSLPRRMAKHDISEATENLNLKLGVGKKNPVFSEKPALSIGLYDAVKVLADLPNSRVKVGMRGHVVELYENPPAIAEVEIAEADDVRQISLVNLMVVDKA